MTKITLRSIVLGAALALGLAAPAAAQFGKYVALGDSLTAGVEGNCVVERNQRASFPAVIAEQIGIDDFQQPLVQEVPLSSPLTGSPCLGAVFIPPSTITVGAVSQQGAPLNLSLPRPYDNLGLPGARVRDLVDLRHGNPGGTTVEMSAALVLRNVPGSPFDGTNAVEQANILQPDLVTLWIGNNDVLGAALAGVVVDGVTLTPVAAFTAEVRRGHGRDGGRRPDDRRGQHPGRHGDPLHDDDSRDPDQPGDPAARDHQRKHGAAARRGQRRVSVRAGPAGSWLSPSRRNARDAAGLGAPGAGDRRAGRRRRHGPASPGRPLRPPGHAGIRRDALSERSRGDRDAHRRDQRRHRGRDRGSARRHPCVLRGHQGPRLPRRGADADPFVFDRRHLLRRRVPCRRRSGTR